MKFTEMGSEICYDPDLKTRGLLGEFLMEAAPGRILHFQYFLIKDLAPQISVIGEWEYGDK